MPTASTTQQTTATTAPTDTPLRRRLDPATRRESILGAATAAFAHSPYAAVSVVAIAEEAGVSEALVHRYFDGKPGLYGEVVRGLADALLTRLDAADAELPRRTSRRDRVHAFLEVFLDHVATRPQGWAAPFMNAGNDPESILLMRKEIRAELIARLRSLASPGRGLRADYAIEAFLGLVDSACVTWVERGCPTRHRQVIIDTALDALEGALGARR